MKSRRRKHVVSGDEAHETIDATECHISDLWPASHAPVKSIGDIGLARCRPCRSRLPLGHGAIDGGVGYYDLRSQVGFGYAYWSAGVGKQWRNWQVAVRYIGTDAQARHLFQTLAGNRVVGSVAWLF